MVGEVGTEDQGDSNVGETGERNDSDMVCQGKGRGLTAEVETAEGSDTAERNDTAAETEGRQRQMDGRRRGRAQTAMEGRVKEGIRLWWWLEEGEGHNAKGPGSVTARRRARTE